MSEKPDQLDPKEIAAHPAIKQLLENLRTQFGIEFFIVGAGTPKQEAEYQALLEKQETERREARERYTREHGISGEVLLKILTCLAETTKRN